MLIQCALTLTVLLGFCGLALDVGWMQLSKLKLQNAADAAALGASYQWNPSSPAAAWQAAKQDAANNGFTDGVNGVTVAQPFEPSSGTYAQNPSAVQLVVSQTVNPIFFTGARTISAQATALASSATACSYMFSTESTAQPSLVDDSGNITGSCSVYLGLGYKFSNGSSNGPQYLVAGSSAGTGTVSPAAQTNVGVKSDPLSSVPPPTIPSTCAATNSYPNGGTIQANQKFCGGLTIGGNTTLSSGNYVIQGPLSIGNSTITGSHVLLYMEPLNDGTCGTITIAGSGHVLSAPVSGPQQGILIYTDRSCPVSASSNGELYFNQANGNAGTLDGILYLPGQKVYASQSTLKGSKYFGIVADWLNMSQGKLVFSSDYSDLADGTPFKSGQVTLVQ